MSWFDFVLYVGLLLALLFLAFLVVFAVVENSTRKTDEELLREKRKQELCR